MIDTLGEYDHLKQMGSYLLQWHRREVAVPIKTNRGRHFPASTAGFGTGHSLDLCYNPVQTANAKIACRKRFIAVFFNI